jgi:hypothetical protein
VFPEVKVVRQGRSGTEPPAKALLCPGLDPLGPYLEAAVPVPLRTGYLHGLSFLFLSFFKILFRGGVVL